MSHTQLFVIACVPVHAELTWLLVLSRPRVLVVLPVPDRKLKLLIEGPGSLAAAMAEYELAQGVDLIILLVGIGRWRI